MRKNDPRAGLPTWYEPEWKRFLTLGEQLLEQPHAAAQRDLIVTTVARRLSCQVGLWFCKPFYPLPGQPDIETLPQANAPHLVKRAYTLKRMVCPEEKLTEAEMPGRARKVAVPLITQNNLLAVLIASRSDGQSFNSDDLEYLQGVASHAALTMQVARQATLKNWRSEQLALVGQVSAQIANVLDLDELCARVTRLIQETFAYYYVGILTLESDQHTLRFRAGAATSGVTAPLPDFNIRTGEGMVGYASETGMELVVQDVQLEPIYRHLDSLPETRSEAVFPLKVENRILGVLDVQNDQDNAFHEVDVQVLRSLASNIAIAIEGISLYRNVQSHNEQLSTVFEATRALSSILELDVLLEEIVRLIQRRFNFPFVHVFTVHAGRGKIIYRAGTGERSQAMRDGMINYDLNDPTGIIPWVARNGNIIIANDVEKEPLYRPSELPPANTRSEMSIPLIFGGEVLGVMDIQSDRVNAFDENSRPLFEILASNIAVAIRNALMYRSERWRRQVADSFRDVAGLISANTELDELLESILCELERNLPADASAIWLLDDSNPEEVASENKLHLAAVHGVESDNVVQLISQNEIARQWLETAITYTQPVIRRPGNPIGPLGLALQCGDDYSSVAAPLIAGDKPLGILVLAHRTGGRYGSEARDMTRTFASYAAVAIQNSRLFAEAQAQAWVSTVLLQVAESTQSITTVEDLSAAMVRLTPLLVGVQKSAIYMWDEGQQAFVLKDWYEIDLPEDYPFYYDENTTPALARLRATQAAIYISDPEAELNLPAGVIPDGSGTIVLMPLLAHGTLLGGFLVVHQRISPTGLEVPFDEQSLAILQGITHQTALALENLKLIESRQEEGYVTAVMLQVSQAVASQNKLDDILDTIVHLMPILVGIDACLIYLWDDVLEEFYPAQVFTGSHDEEEQLFNRTYDPGEFELLDRVFGSETLFCPLGKADLPPDEWPSLYCLTEEEFSAVSPYTTSAWLMGFPISVKGETYGVMLAKETRSTPAFRERRVEIITGVAQQVALAIQNERFNTEVVERERLEREFQLAREIQQTFLPYRLPSPAGWEVDARWQTARTVGGDFYDVFRLGKKRLGLVIADVSDKGMPAALYMTVTRTLLRADAQNHASPARVLEHVNNMLLADSQTGMFVTTVYGILDLETGVLTYANAGHNRPLIYCADTNEVKVLEKGNMALAVLEDNKYTEHSIELKPGDQILFYTDGVTESFTSDGEAFGEERLIEVFKQVNENGGQKLLDRLNAALVEFRDGAPPSDDVTLLSVKRK